MKHRAQTTVKTTQEIIGNAVAGIQDVVTAELPNLRTIRRNIRRQRQVVNNPLPVPLQRDDLPNPLPHECSTTNAGAPFLLWDIVTMTTVFCYMVPRRRFLWWKTTRTGLLMGGSTQASDLRSTHDSSCPGW